MIGAEVSVEIDETSLDATERNETSRVHEIFRRLRRLAYGAAIVVGATLLVCETADPYIERWTNNFGNEMGPVTDKLDNVSERTGDLNATVQDVAPRIADPLSSVDESLSSMVSTTTTRMPDVYVTTLPTEE